MARPRAGRNDYGRTISAKCVLSAPRRASRTSAVIAWGANWAPLSRAHSLRASRIVLAGL